MRDEVQLVAVVPLVDLNATDDNAYFGIGLTQELVAAIANFQELTVLDVPPLLEGESIAGVTGRLGREAGVRFVLSGSFRKTDDTLVLRIQLTDCLWLTRIFTAATVLVSCSRLSGVSN